MKKKSEQKNILELRPVHLYTSEVTEDGNFVVLVPKFQGKFAQWFMPQRQKTNFRVKLDALGSFVWKNCNGETSAKEIAERMKTEFGESAEPVYERVGEFIKQLHRGKLIDLGLAKE